MVRNLWKTCRGEFRALDNLNMYEAQRHEAVWLKKYPRGGRKTGKISRTESRNAQEERAAQRWLNYLLKPGTVGGRSKLPNRAGVIVSPWSGLCIEAWKEPVKLGLVFPPVGVEDVGGNIGFSQLIFISLWSHECKNMLRNIENSLNCCWNLISSVVLQFSQQRGKSKRIKMDVLLQN